MHHYFEIMYPGLLYSLHTMLVHFSISSTFSFFSRFSLFRPNNGPWCAFRKRFGPLPISMAYKMRCQFSSHASTLLPAKFVPRFLVISRKPISTPTLLIHGLNSICTREFMMLDKGLRFQ